MFSDLHDEVEGDIEEVQDIQTSILMEAALEVS